jgi:hypothetical protein
MAQVCLYMVTSAPSGCSKYRTGDIVEGPCDDGNCYDIVISDGTCKDAYLTAITCGCTESSGS